MFFYSNVVTDIPLVCVIGWVYSITKEPLNVGEGQNTKESFIIKPLSITWKANRDEYIYEGQVKTIAGIDCFN